MSDSNDFDFDFDADFDFDSRGSANADSSNNPDSDIQLADVSDNLSEGFIAETENEDPFNSEPVSSPLDNNVDEGVGDGEASKLESTKRDTVQQRSTFKMLKSHGHTLGSRLGIDPSMIVDPEEEKLKMLPDCCEFTSRKVDAYEEVDDSRKTMSSHWFGKIVLNPSMRKQLCFAESLLITEENGSVVGKMYCSVTPSKWGENACLCVHSGSCAKFSTGLESGTSITSFINYKMQPLQEYVHEWATLGSETMERKTFIINEGDKMPCKITSIRNGKVVDTKTINLGIKERDHLVTEGSNILLLRLLIYERRTNGNMNLQSLCHTGKVVKSKYAELGGGWENVRGKHTKTWGIRRTVDIEDEERSWDFLFNKYARLVLRCQPDSPQALIPLWFEGVRDFDKYGNFIGINTPYVWACDAEFYSKYCVKKESLNHEYRRYIIDHPEMKALLSDYLQTILFRKPQDVIEFTKHYFEPFMHLRNKQAVKNKPSESSETSSSYYDDSYSRSSVGSSTEGRGSVWGSYQGSGENLIRGSQQSDGI